MAARVGSRQEERRGARSRDRPGHHRGGLDLRPVERCESSLSGILGSLDADDGARRRTEPEEARDHGEPRRLPRQHVQLEYWRAHVHPREARGSKVGRGGCRAQGAAEGAGGARPPEEVRRPAPTQAGVEFQAL